LRRYAERRWFSPRRREIPLRTRSSFASEQTRPVAGPAIARRIASRAGCEASDARAVEEDDRDSESGSEGGSGATRLWRIDVVGEEGAIRMVIASPAPPPIVDGVHYARSSKYRASPSMTKTAASAPTQASRTFTVRATAQGGERFRPLIPSHPTKRTSPPTDTYRPSRRSSSTRRTIASVASGHRFASRHLP
jgi:hypothetical protein